MSDRLYQVAAAPFDAARQVKILPPGHRARRLHGHSFIARVRACLPEQWRDEASDRTDALVHALGETVGQLDYRDLNACVETPTDENLARYVRRHLEVPGIETVGIQSTRDQGADLDAQEQVHLWRSFRFEAAHQLPRVPAGHPCGRMHGHGFEVIIHAMQNVQHQDMGLDFDALAALWAPYQAQLHLACLNDLPGLENPTSELIAHWLWQRLQPDLPSLSWVTVYETSTAGCHYDGTHYRIWKELRFESAVQLRRVPEGDPRRRLHGHSYLLRLHLGAPLDAILGWTVDYGDVKTLFNPVYAQLDHHRLDALPGLAEADPGHLVHWIRTRIVERLPQLDRIDLHQTPGCGASLCWGPLDPALPS